MPPDDDLDRSIAEILAEALDKHEARGETPPPPAVKKRPTYPAAPLQRIDPARAARLAALPGYEKTVIGQYLADLARWGAGAPPPGGETPWARCGQSWWQRWYHGSLCIVQKMAARRYDARVNGASTGATCGPSFLELRDAQASAEITARSSAIEYARQNTHTSNREESDAI